MIKKKLITYGKVIFSPINWFIGALHKWRWRSSFLVTPIKLLLKGRTLFIHITSVWQTLDLSLIICANILREFIHGYWSVISKVPEKALKVYTNSLPKYHVKRPIPFSPSLTPSMQRKVCDIQKKRYAVKHLFMMDLVCQAPEVGTSEGTGPWGYWPLRPSLNSALGETHSHSWS